MALKPGGLRGSSLKDPAMHDEELELPGGRYKILEPLGAGGMAQVYRAYDQKLDREVAVKVPNERVLRDDVARERFRREARSSAGLNHSNIVSIYDFVEDEQRPYLVMELVEGEDLGSYLASSERLDPEEAIRIGAAILDAIGYAHDQGLVHRDLSPHNILLERSTGVVKVSDFGIVRALGDKTLTEDGQMVGSVLTMSPEQAKGERVDRRCDLYSVGCLLYLMVTGQCPFTGDNPVQVALKHVSEQVTSPLELVPGLPDNLVATILKALEKEPQKRFVDAEAMKAALKGLVELPPSPQPEPEVSAAQPSSSRFPWVLALLLVLMAGGLLVATERWLSNKVEVPELTGLSQGQAQERLEALGLTLKVSERVPSRKHAKDVVVGQSPPRGVKVRPPSEVRVTLSEGTPALKVPRLVGLTESQARDELQKLRLAAEFREESDSSIPPGMVKSQEPPPETEIGADQLVVVVLSSGAEALKVPDLLGLSEEAARQRLEELGLEMIVEAYRKKAQTPEGVVLSQNPSAGARASRGRRVFLVLSRGDADLHAPELEGKTLSEARRITQELGIELQVEGEAQEEDPIVFQDPPPGEFLEEPLMSVRATPSTVVPSVTGLELAEAESKVRSAGLSLGEIRRVYGPRAGEVVDQDPMPGIELPPNSVVDLFVAEPSLDPNPGPGPEVIPTPLSTPEPWVE